MCLTVCSPLCESNFFFFLVLLLCCWAVLSLWIRLIVACVARCLHRAAPPESAWILKNAAAFSNCAQPKKQITQTSAGCWMKCWKWACIWVWWQEPHPFNALHYLNAHTLTMWPPVNDRKQANVKSCFLQPRSSSASKDSLLCVLTRFQWKAAPTQ